MEYKGFSVKQGVEIEDLLRISPAMSFVLSVARAVAEEIFLEIVVTSLISDRRGLMAVTEVHGRGDGVDLRTRNWRMLEKEVFTNTLNEQLAMLAPIGKKVVVIESNHIHLQVRAGIKWEQLRAILNT